jgi:hypothetical protein
MSSTKYLKNPTEKKYKGAERDVRQVRLNTKKVQSQINQWKLTKQHIVSISKVKFIIFSSNWHVHVNDFREKYKRFLGSKKR